MTRTALALVLICAASAAMAQVREVPDPQATPGAVATTDLSDICGRVDGLTYTKRHRVWTRQRETMQRYGVPWEQRRQYEDDDEVPVCLGGDNGNPANHWAQPGDQLTPDGFGYQAKDWLDAESCRLTCMGQVSPSEAQGWFLAPADWRVTYCRLRADDPKCAQR